MDYIRTYPTVAMFLVFFISSCAFAYSSYEIKIASICLSAAVLIVTAIVSLIKRASWVRSSLRKAILLMTAAICASACISTVAFDIHAAKADELAGKTDSVTVTVLECEYTLSYSSCFVATVESSELLPRGTKVLLTTSMGYVDAGTVLEGEVEYISLNERSHGGFTGRKYYLSRRIMLEAEEIELSVAGFDNGFSLTRLFGEINDRLTAMLMAHTDYEAGGIAAAALLGNKAHLTDQLSRDYRRIGITHLLVVSGSHFAVLVAFAENSMKKLRVGRKARALCNIAIILLFMGLTGFSPSVIRAGIMHIMVQLSKLLFKKANSINSLALSGTLLIITNPYSALDCGMQLSFVAAYSCIMFEMLKGSVYAYIKHRYGITPSRSAFLRMVRNIAETVILTALVNLCTLPLIWLYFGEISLISVPANVVFIPLITILMYLAGAYLILYPLVIFTPLTAIILNAYCGFINSLAEALSSMKYATVAVNYSFTAYFLIPAALILMIVPMLKNKLRMSAIVLSAAICVSFFALIGVIESRDRDNIHFSYITSGANDGFVIKTDGQALLCDISSGSYSFSRSLTAEAASLHMTEIDYLLLTHYHNKHIQLIGRLAESEVLRGVILPEPIDERERGLNNSLCGTAEMMKLEVITIPSGGSFYFGDTVITLFERTYLSRSTHPITAVEIEMRDESAVILSCSFNESVDEIILAAENADHLIFGTHSPVYKKTFGLEFSNEPKEIVYCENAYEYMDENLRQYVDTAEGLCNVSEYRVIIRRNE